MIKKTTILIKNNRTITTNDNNINILSRTEQMSCARPAWLVY